MKKTLLLGCGMLFAAMSTNASDIGVTLDRKDVSAFDLIANNLNIVYLMDKSQKDKSKKPEKVDQAEEIFSRFSVSKEHRLVIESFYKAPVAKVTKDECNMVLLKLAEEKSQVSKAIVMLSPYKLSIDEAKQITDQAHLIAYLQAEENNQLSLNCSK